MGFPTAWVDAVRLEVLQATEGFADAGVALAGGPHPLFGERPLIVLVRDENDAQFLDAVRAVADDVCAGLPAAPTSAPEAAPGEAAARESASPEARAAGAAGAG